MTKRPIIWGIIVFVIGIVGWFVSVIFSIVTLGHFRGLANFFGYVFLWSLPVALILECILWIKRKK